MVRIVVGASICGLLLLLASSLFVDNYRSTFEGCKQLPGGTCNPGCKRLQFYVIGGAMGIIAALVQILSSGLAFIGKEKGWSMSQILVIILIIIAFALPTSEEAFKIESVAGNSSFRPRALFFLSWCIIDGLFAVASMLVVLRSSS